MSNTKIGARKIQSRYGRNFYSQIGSRGGKTTANRYFGKKHKGR